MFDRKNLVVALDLVVVANLKLPIILVIAQQFHTQS